MRLASGRSPLAATLVAVGLSAALVAGTTTPRVEAHRAASTLFLNAAGSTFIAPLMAKWGFLYGQANKSVRLNYQGIGSGAGIAALTAGTVDFAGSDAFLNATQTTAIKSNVVHIPLTLGPVAILYNLPGVSNLKLDGTTLAQIFLGKITSWNDKAIATLNPGVTLPSTSITVAHRSDGSGTSFIVSNYLAAVSSDWQSTAGAGLLPNWPTGRGGKGTPGVVQIVKSTAGAIGYGELSYAISSGLPFASIQNKAGQFVPASIDGAAQDAANAPSLPADLKALIVNEPGAKSYPITGFSWGLVYKTVPSSSEYARYQQVLSFLWWCIHQGQTGIPQSGALRYASLPANVVKADEAAIKSVTYNGKPVFTGH